MTTAPVFQLEPLTLATAEALLVECAINMTADDQTLAEIVVAARRAAATAERRFAGAPHVRSVILDLRHVAHISEPVYAHMHELRRQCGLLGMDVYALPPAGGSPIVRMWPVINGWFFPVPPAALVSRAITYTTVASALA